MNGDTGFESAPPRNIGNVSLSIVWRILCLRREFGISARILLSKMNVKDAFRQITINSHRSPVFGFTFEKLVGVGRRLQFGWRNNPGLWCLFADALEHSHKNTTFDNAVITDLGHGVTAHVGVIPPSKAKRQSQIHPNVALSPGTGRGVENPFFVECYVDDAISVERQWFNNGRQLRVASESLASNHSRLMGDLHIGDPPLLSPRKASSWNTPLVVLGWEINTAPMAI